MKQFSDAEKELVARVMHEAVRAFQSANNQSPSPHWNKAPKWMKKASIEAVEFRISNPNASAADQHDQWSEEKKHAGWKFGSSKDAEEKTHPLLIPYEELPFIERQKDALVASIITALTTKL